MNFPVKLVPMDTFNATFHTSSYLCLVFPFFFLCLQDAVKQSSGIPYTIENKVREGFNSQGKQLPYYCCCSDKEVLGSCCSSQIHMPLWTQGIQSVIHSLDAQGLFHNHAFRERFLTSSPCKPHEIWQVHGGSVSAQGPALWPVQNCDKIHPVWCWLWQQFTVKTQNLLLIQNHWLRQERWVPQQPAQL